jgi:hypothetical protein
VLLVAVVVVALVFLLFAAAEIVVVVVKVKFKLILRHYDTSRKVPGSRPNEVN